MFRKFAVSFASLLLIPVLLYAQNGKIRGKVTDKETGDPLIGANITMTGTSMGAASDVNGEYTIVNVDVGTFEMKVSYVGYQTLTVSNVRVNSNLSTEQNFALSSTSVATPVVDIVAQRPLINKNATNAVRIIDNDFFDKVPARGINAAIALQPGVVMQNNNIYIRGGRLDEVGFKMESAGVGDVLFGGQAINVSAEAVEQIQVLAGGYNAEFGGANAGLVNSSLRSGAEQWKLSLLGETDRIAAYGKKSLGAYSRGYSDYTLTLGGPVLTNNVRFFGSLENTFYRDANVAVNGITIVPSPRVWDGFDFSGSNAVVTNALKGVYHPNDVAADTLNLTYPAGNRLNDQYNLINGSGSLLFDFGGGLKLRGAGSYAHSTSRDPAGAGNVLNWQRTTLRISDNGFGNVKFTHVVSPQTFYEINLNYFGNTTVGEDPDFKDNLKLYGDSAANAKLGYFLEGESQNWSAWSLYGGNPNGLSVNQPGTQIAGYDKINETSMGGRVDLSSQMKSHELKFGGEYTRYTIRRYNPTNPFQMAAVYQNPVYTTQAALGRALRQLYVGSNNFGYDVFGNQIDSDLKDPMTGDILDFGPAHPVFGAGYVQDKIELSDLVLQLGLRYDYIDPNSWALVNPYNIALNDTLKVASAKNLTKTPVTQQVSPRIGLSFAVSEHTVFHAQYGKFIQQSRLRDSYYGMGGFYGLMYSGFFITNVVGWGLRPERTTQYEMGFAQSFSDVASFDVTAFYKDITDQVQFTFVLPGAGAANAPYGAFINGDFATTQGIEFKLTLRRTNRMTAQVNYTISDARSTGSNPTSLAGAAVVGAVPYLPHYVFPSTFNYPQQGNVSLDYRFAKDDGGPILEQLGANLLLQFNSGHSFTRLVQEDNATGDPRNRIPAEQIGSSTTPWFFQLDGRLDKTISFGSFSMNIYVYVINLLGTNNAVDVFNRSGAAGDDGWLSTNSGRQATADQGQKYADFYRAVFLGANANNYGPPRSIRFGMKLEY